MGGDHAPGPEVAGAVAAVRERMARVLLVGDEPRLLAELRKIGAEGEVPVRHASEVITMADHPGAAAKSKKDSSMRVAFELAKRGEVDGLVSAGNSGAVLACGLFVMKRLPGIDRPGIVTTFPTRVGVCALIDMGANVECRPQTLAQFAVLGSVYSRMLHRKKMPRVGLLSNGEEAVKGTELTRGAHKLLESAACAKDFEFVGYVEGRDIFSGHVDVVVTDGFTGNVVLKTSEGAAQVLFDLMRDEIRRARFGRLGALLLGSAFKRVKSRLDVDEAGGAPLVGIDGVAILCHGRANATAVKNAIRVASSLATESLPQAISEAVAKHGPLWAADIVQKSGS